MPDITSGVTKFTGAASVAYDYLTEKQSNAKEALGYYGHQDDEHPFRHVGGKAAALLPGLDLHRGLTIPQFTDLHNGSWNGEQLVPGGYKKVQALDADGKPKFEVDPLTGRRHKVYEQMLVLDEHGKQKLDPETGLPLTKDKTVKTRVAFNDVTFSFSKDVAEYLVRYPQHAGVIRDCMVKAVDKAMRVAVEEHCAVVAKTKQRPSELKDRTTKTQGSATELVKADGLIWTITVGSAARPTKAAMHRGYDADVHPHCHVVWFNMARTTDGKWQATENLDLTRSHVFRASVATNEFNRLMEDHGFRITYLEPTLQGTRRSLLDGSNAAARRYLSTNTQRMESMLRQFVKENEGKTWTAAQRKAAAKESKFFKTPASREADELGNVDHLGRVRSAMERDGVKLTVLERGAVRPRACLDDRQLELLARLEHESGLGAVVDSSGYFTENQLLPAVYEAARGLGFTSKQLATFSNWYRDELLISHRIPGRYTTASIIDAELTVRERLDDIGKWKLERVPDHIVQAAIKGAEHDLDDEQLDLVRAICNRNSITHGIGAAGTGKSQSLKAAVSALRESKLVSEVIVVAAGKIAATDTAKKVGANAGLSVKGFQLKVTHGWKPTDKTLIICEEVGVFSSFHMATVASALKPGVRLVTVGDDKQALPVSVGGWYSQELDARPAVKLLTPHRFRDRRDVRDHDLVRNGQAERALENLQMRDRVFEAEDDQALPQVVAERWQYHRNHGLKVEDLAIVHSGANARMDTLAAAVQRMRIERGELDETARVTFHQERDGRHWDLYGPAEGQKYGDRVLVVKGIYGGRLMEPVLNGTYGWVRNVHKDGALDIQLDGGRKIRHFKLPATSAEQWIAPAYAVSTNKFQGKEVAMALSVCGSQAIESLNNAYPRNTRGSDGFEVIYAKTGWGADPVREIAEAWATPVEKQLAYVQAMLRQEIPRQQRDDLAQRVAEAQSLSHGFGY